MTSVTASRVLTPSGWIGPARVGLHGPVITSIESVDTSVDRWLVPGFVDLQVNGIEDIDVAAASGADWERLDALLAAQGVTTWCPTLVTMPLHHYGRPLAAIGAASARPQGGRPAIAGAHLEGPFLGDAPGAHPSELIVPVDLEWLSMLPPHVAVVTLGAEQPLASEATRLLTSAGRLVAIGHSRATEAQFDAVVQAGARLVTHLFNAMSGLHHRSPGVAAFAITEPGVSTSLIADAVHVHPRMLALAFQAVGADRAVLVTDSVAWRAGTAGVIGLTLAGGAPRLPDGTLAGSALTMDAAVRNCVAAGVPAEHAIQAASRNPARLLGLSDRGTISVGQRADLVALSPELEIEQVWASGVATPILSR